jgi:hypothetical protein
MSGLSVAAPNYSGTIPAVALRSPLPFEERWLNEIRDVSDHYLRPVSRQGAIARFHELAERWKLETMFLSSTTAMVLNSSYQQIIGMGREALPLILAELSREPNHWFWALRSIVGEDPVPPDARGDVRAMRAAWLNWAREQGMRW